MHNADSIPALKGRGKAWRRDLLGEYRQRFGRGLLTTVALATGKDKSVVSRTYWGHIERPDLRVVEMLSAELEKLADLRKASVA
jgi:hypothetical protein